MSIYFIDEHRFYFKIMTSLECTGPSKEENLNSNFNLLKPEFLEVLPGKFSASNFSSTCSTGGNGDAFVGGGD